jgi:hypothetical protein
MCDHCRNIPDCILSPDEWCIHCREGMMNIADGFTFLAYALVLLQLCTGFMTPITGAALGAVGVAVWHRTVGSRMENH